MCVIAMNVLLPSVWAVQRGGRTAAAGTGWTFRLGTQHQSVVAVVTGAREEQVASRVPSHAAATDAQGKMGFEIQVLSLRVIHHR